MLPRTYYTEQDIRKRQIDTLKVFNDHVTEIQENSKYNVEFVSNGKKMHLCVVLPPEFPNEQPSIYVYPPILHPWIAENSNQVTAAPGLVNFTVHSDLGRVVQAIIQEFRRYLPASSGENTSNVACPQMNSAHSLIHHELGGMTADELVNIMDNHDLQDKLIKDDRQLLELNVESEVLINSIEELAKDNLAKQQSLELIKAEVIDRISTIMQLKMKYEELDQKHQELAHCCDPRHIRNCLKAAAGKADEESEVIAEQFLLGKMKVEDFVTQFSEKRALGQARRAMEERLAHQITQLDKATT